jgi:hypothetical protein
MGEIRTPGYYKHILRLSSNDAASKSVSVVFNLGTPGLHRQMYVQPGQLNISDGVTARITLASVGGVEGSFFTDHRPLP